MKSNRLITGYNQRVTTMTFPAVVKRQSGQNWLGMAITARIFMFAANKRY
jgi:hypothetical protein